MKSLSSFMGLALTRAEMKNVVGGAMWRCKAENLVSTSFPAKTKAEAQAICNQNSYCTGWGGGGCTVVKA